MLRDLQRNSKRWFIAFIITLFLLFGTNMAWLYVFQSYDYETEEYEQDGNGYNNINTGKGNINNGITSFDLKEGE